MEQEEWKKIYRSAVLPVFFLITIWSIWALEQTFGWKLELFGILPRDVSGLKGILFYPLLHGDFLHILHNSYSFLVLSLILFYFYRTIAYRIFFFIYFFSGIGLWIIGRSNYHIGASGVIYGLAFFIFASGIIRRHIGLMSISMIIAFLYGSMVWYLFPIEDRISWEGHSAGAVTGVVLALIYRKHGPQREVREWDDDEDDENDIDTTIENFDDIKIIYRENKDLN